MFLAKLLCGNEVHLDPDESPSKAAQYRALTVPPTCLIPNLEYNSMTGHAGGSQVFVVYENGRAYPDYLVRYYHGKRDTKRTPYKSRRDAMAKSKNYHASSKKMMADLATENSDSGDLEEVVGSSSSSPSVSTNNSSLNFIWASSTPTYSSSLNWTWEFRDGSGWKQYGPVERATLEDGYQAYLLDRSNNTVQIKMDEWTYEVDVDTKTETNIQHSSRQVRNVRRRVGPAAVP